jgi:rSAM/selenodomain-associated transferase 1
MMRHVIVFTRAPQLGNVKRRLAAGIGALAALRFHRAMQVQLARGIAKDRRWKTWIAVTPDISSKSNLFSGAKVLKQGRGDLGQRMARCFRALPPGPAVLIGSDIPDINAAHLARAFSELGKNDAVFGPAGDGGYWLVGMKRLRSQPADLFRGVRWSGPHALADTIEAMGSSARIGLVDPLSDVDSAEDYHHWRRLCSSRRGMISTKLQGRKR